MPCRKKQKAFVFVHSPAINTKADIQTTPRRRRFAFPDYPLIADSADRRSSSSFKEHSLTKTEKPAGRPRGPKQIEAEANLMRKRAEATGSVKPEPNVFEDNGGQQKTISPFDRSYTMADAFAAPKFIPQRIRGILPLHGLSLIYGAPGSLKSMLALHCAVGVALGRHIMAAEDGTGGVPVRRCNTLILDSDNGMHRLGMRLAAIARGFGVEHVEDIPNLRYRPMMFNGAPISITTPAGLDALQRAMDEAGAELVFFDSYGGMCGGADINHPDMQRHLLNTRAVFEARGACGCGIHHSNKNGGIMGTQHFLSTADVPIQITRPEMTGNLIEFAAQKIRDESTPVPSATWWRESTPAVDEFGMEISLLIRAGFRADPAAPAEKGGDLAERVALEVLREYPEGLKQGALVASIHENISQQNGRVSERHIRDVVLPRMMKCRLLRMETGRHNAKVYVPGPAAAEVKP